MPENKPQRLSDVLATYAPEGSNDARWFLIEHQLEQVKISARTIVGSLSVIVERPENDVEAYIADDCLSFMREMLLDILEKSAALHSYLSGSDVAERISRKEL